MKKQIWIVLFASALALPLSRAEEKDHDHDHDQKHGHAHEKHGEEKPPTEKGQEHAQEHERDYEEAHGHEDHEKEAGHDHAKESGHGHDEGGASIGPGKGILAKGELGFKLSPEAVQSFELEFTKATALLSIPPGAVVKIKEAQSVFREREGCVERIPAKVVGRAEGKAKVQISEFQEGDKIVTNGVGFLRTAEVIAEEGASHSH